MLSRIASSLSPRAESAELNVLGILELDSVAEGYRVLDTLVKSAPVAVLLADVLNPGKFLIMITGDVASVEESMKRGIKAAAETLLDYLFITNLHPDVIPALKERQSVDEADALGIIEAFSIVGGVEAADVAAKESDVRVLEVRIGDEMGGKSTATIHGPIGEVEAALDVARGLLEEKDLLVRTVAIARPHDDLRVHVEGS